MPGLRKLSVLIVVVCSTTILVPDAQAVPQSYSVQVLPKGAFALNDLGHVALRTDLGRDGDGRHIYSIDVWRNGTITTLATGVNVHGCDMNNSGQVVGYQELDGSDQIACMWTEGGRTDIAYGDAAVAVGINDAGHVVGTHDDYGARRGYVWDGSATTDLNMPGAVDSEAYDINNANQITGSVTYRDEGPRYTGSRGYSVLWDGGEGTFLHEVGYHAFGGLINNVGQIMGYRYEENLRSVLWTDGVMVDLGDLGAGVTEAYDLNDLGQVVGASGIGPREGHLFIWEDGAMSDLTLILSNGSPYLYDTAMQINNSGQILAAGWDVSGPAQCSFLLTPIPEPSCLAAMGAGLIGLAGFAIRGPRTRHVP